MFIELVLTIGNSDMLRGIMIPEPNIRMAEIRRILLGYPSSAGNVSVIRRMAHV